MKDIEMIMWDRLISFISYMFFVGGGSAGFRNDPEAYGFHLPLHEPT